MTRRTLAAVHASYYLASGAFPLVSRRGFERVTGPKPEWWLVVTVSGLVGAIGIALAISARGEPSSDIVALGAASAGAMGVVDVAYVARRRIAPVYLLDAAVQLPLAAAWAVSARRA